MSTSRERAKAPAPRLITPPSNTTLKAFSSGSPDTTVRETRSTWQLLLRSMRRAVCTSREEAPTSVGACSRRSSTPKSLHLHLHLHLHPLHLRHNLRHHRQLLHPHHRLLSAAWSRGRSGYGSWRQSGRSAGGTARSG